MRSPLNVTASIMLEGQELNFTVRRQGSVYLYTPSSATGLTAAAPPSFVQLDGWHEHTHFSWWSSDFQIEAELYKDFEPVHLATSGASAVVRTELPKWREGDSSHDLTQARTFVSIGGDRDWHNTSAPSPSFTYEVEPRPVSRGMLTETGAATRSYRVELVMRAPLPSQTACVIVRLAHKKLGAGGVRSAEQEDIGVACVAGSASWQRVDVGEVVALETAQKHELTLAEYSGTAHVDHLRLVELED